MSTNKAAGSRVSQGKQYNILLLITPWEKLQTGPGTSYGLDINTPSPAASTLIQNSLHSPKATSTELSSSQDWATPGPGVALRAEETGDEKASRVGMAVSPKAQLHQDG